MINLHPRRNLMGTQPTFQRQTCHVIATGLILLGLFWIGSVASNDSIHAQEPASQSKPTSSKQDKSSDAENEAETKVKPEQPFVPDFIDQDLMGSENRAWEYRPYSVAVWFCLDGSPQLNSVYKQVALDVTQRSEMIDPSGWDLTTGLAPSRWRYRFLNNLNRPDKLQGVGELKSLEGYDKLMIVCVASESGSTLVRVREFDVQTQQWGPIVRRELAQHSNLGQAVMNAITVAFMPIAKIDRIQELTYVDAKGKTRIKDEVVMQIRGVQSCVRTRRKRITLKSQLEKTDSFFPDSPVTTEAAGTETEPSDSPPREAATNEANSQAPSEDKPAQNPDQITQKKLFEWVAGPIKGSPVYIKDDDRFLPVIRRTDRKGNLVRLEPIEFTYLTVNAQDEAVLRASIESYHRAPLAQRKSKRAQKLALVIRPPQQPTTLYLYSSEKDPQPLEGFEIWSRRPGASIEEKSEFLGKTNWRGGFEVKPSEEGLLIVYVKRGSRVLRRLPIMPGLYESVSTTLPNDETRLFSEGVIQGLQNEILGLVIQREVFETEIDAAIKAKDATTAKAKLTELQELESPTDFKNRMSEDKSMLLTQTSDARELGYINKRFDTLRKLLSEQEKKSRKNEFIQTILDMTAKKSDDDSGPDAN